MSEVCRLVGTSVCQKGSTSLLSAAELRVVIDAALAGANIVVRNGILPISVRARQSRSHVGGSQCGNRRSTSMLELTALGAGDIADCQRISLICSWALSLTSSSLHIPTEEAAGTSWRSRLQISARRLLSLFHPCCKLLTSQHFGPPSFRIYAHTRTSLEFVAAGCNASLADAVFTSRAAGCAVIACSSVGCRALLTI